MFVTHFFLIFLIYNKSLSVLIFHLTSTCQHLSRKLVSLFSELVGCLMTLSIEYFLLLFHLIFAKLLYCVLHNQIFSEGPSLT